MLILIDLRYLLYLYLLYLLYLLKMKKKELLLSQQLFSPHHPDKYYNLLFCTYISML